MDWKSTLGAVAPQIAKALGGPLAGTAVKFLADKLLGNPSASQAEVQKFVDAGLGPEQLVAVQKMETDFKTHMADLGVDLERINQADRASARDREVKSGDSWTPRLLAAIVTFGFFSILARMMTMGLPEEGSQALLIMLGSLGTAWTGIIAYYFGSSSGSAAKTDALAKATK